MGTQRPPATAREGATMGMEAGHEEVHASIAHDLQSEPKLVSTFSPLPYSCPFVGLHRPGFTRRPRPQGSRRKATPATTAVLPLLVLDLCSPLFLPPGLFSGPAGVGVFLGITSLHGHTGRHLSRLPTRLSALVPLPAGPALAAEPAPPRLAALSAALPVLLTKAASLASSPQASVAPHPHEILGLILPGRRPSVL